MKKPTPIDAEAPRRDVLEQRLRNLEVGEQPAEDRRRADAEERDGRQLAGFEQRVPELVPVHLAVEAERQHGGVDHRGGGGLGRGEPAEQDAADDDERRHQRRDRNRRRLEEFAATSRADRSGSARIFAYDVHGRHLREADQQARDDAGEVERADRHLQHAAPHDHQDRRRDDDRQHRRHRRDRDREREVVAFLDLRLDEDLALARRVGGRRAGDAGEEHRQQHVDLRQRAGEVADHRSRQRDQPVGDAADVHQVGRQQEERHREQDERVVGLERRVEHDHRRQPRLDEQHRQAGEAEREGDRHAQDHQHEERAEQTASPPRPA